MLGVGEFSRGHHRLAAARIGPPPPGLASGLAWPGPQGWPWPRGTKAEMGQESILVKNSRKSESSQNELAYSGKS